MADIQSYERVLKKKDIGTKILMIVIYALIAFVGLLALIKFGFKPQIIVLIPLLLVAIVKLTWRYTQTEYEYSFLAGTATVSKIFGNSSRRTVVELEIRSIISLSVYDSKKMARIASEGGKKIINSLPHKNCQNPCVCVFEDDKKEKIYLILDCDELTAKIFKFFAPSATDRNIFDKLTRSDVNNGGDLNA